MPKNTEPKTKRHKTVSSLLDERIQASSEKLLKQYAKENDPETRLQLRYEIVKKIGRSAIREIAGLSEKDWGRYLREQIKPFAESVDKTSKEMFDQRLKRGQIGVQDLGLIYAEAQILEHFNPLTRLDAKLLARRRTAERFLILVYLQYIGLLYKAGALFTNLEPFYQLNGIVARRFNADHNWSLAVALLATHENLVKKKLVELGVSEENIEHISREKGFASLIQKLAIQIEHKEKRRVTLTFYKSSSLRTLRNKLEHEGYTLVVTGDEVFDLLKDTLRFEAELFPSQLFNTAQSVQVHSNPETHPSQPNR